MTTDVASSIRYHPDDRPPAGLWAALTAQLTIVVTLPLVYPVVVFKAAGTPLPDIPPILSWGLLVLATVVLVQAARGPVGTGYLLPSLPSAIYLQPSVAAVSLGGRSLLAGMTLCAGALETAFAFFVTRFRRFFPPVVTGVIVLVVGLEIGLEAVRLGVDAVRESLASPWVEGTVTGVAFGVILAGVVWGNLLVRNVAPIAGVAVGSVLALAFIDLPATEQRFVDDTAALGSPGLPPLAFDFEWKLLVPFLVLGIAAGLRTVGVVMTLHDAARPGARHPDEGEIRRGVRNDGSGAVLAGIVGFPGVSSAPSAIGASLASGIMSRVVAISLALTLATLACSPRALAYLVTAPAAVVSALLVYYASFMIVGGVRLVVRQPLDVRSTFIVGVSLSAALGARVYGASSTEGGDWVELLTGSMMTVGALTAVLLAVVLRIGQRRRSAFVLASTDGEVTETATTDVRAALGAVGTRPDAAREATSLTVEVLRAIHDRGLADSDVRAEVSTDDLELAIELSYEGNPLSVPVARPLAAEDVTDENVFALGLSRYLDVARPDAAVVRTHGRQVRLRLTYRLL